MKRTLPARVVVTGGRGFVGARLVAALRRFGCEALSMDVRDGADVCDLDAASAWIGEGDTVVHLAATADLYVARDDPVGAARTNVLGTAVIAEATRRRSGRLILGSTLCVYGNQPAYPVREDAVPNPSEIYAQTKLAAEQIVRGMVDSLGLRALIVRFPGVYGEGLRGSMALARFLSAALAGADLEVHGDGLQTRTPLHVDDVVAGLCAAVRADDVDGIVNLAGREEISALELAERVVALAGRGRIVHVAPREPQTMRELADGTRADRLLDWRPAIALDEGMRRTLRWFVAGAATLESPAAPPSTSPRSVELALRLAAELAPIVAAHPAASNPGGLQVAGAATERRLERLGFRVRRLRAGNSPDVLVAHRPGRGLRLGLSAHYDVEEVGDGWTRPACRCSLGDGRLFGRGVADNLGPLWLRFMIVEALGDAAPEMVWVVQGEEEVGSPAAHRLYAGLDLPPIDLWIEETGYFERDGRQRLLVRRRNDAVAPCLDAVVRQAAVHGRAVDFHDRPLNKAFGEQRCPVLAHLVGEAPYVALGPNDPDSKIHGPDESLPVRDLALAWDQFEALLKAAAGAAR
jgi:nucleoside-diphosphate-sugar epimerase